MAKNNPFDLRFGLKPDNLVSRINETGLIIEEFSAEKPSNGVYLITGPRGSGKTVLMSTIFNHFKDESNWVTVDPGPKDDILSNVASMIYDNGKMKRLFAETEFSFSFQGVGFSIKGKTPVSSVYSLLVRMFEYLKKKGQRVLIAIDEADNSDQIKYFIQAYQSLMRQDFPIFLVMTGLYENIYKLQEDKSLTFLYRAPKIFLGPLDMGAMASKYCQYLSVDRSKGIELAKFTKGYAYAYQVLGHILYRKGNAEIDQSVLDEFDQSLAENVYKKIFFDMSEKDKRIVLSFKTPDPIKVSEICDKTGYSINYLSVYRDNLIKTGVVHSPSYGYLQLTLPRFEVFLSYYDHE